MVTILGPCAVQPYKELGLSLLQKRCQDKGIDHLYINLLLSDTTELHLFPWKTYLPRTRQLLGLRTYPKPHRPAPGWGHYWITHRPQSADIAEVYPCTYMLCSLNSLAPGDSMSNV